MSTSSVNVVAHPLVQHKLSLMREKDRSTKSFREILNEIGMLLCYEVTRDLPLELVETETPLETTMAPMIAGKKLTLAPILRAGVGFLDGMLALVPSARVAHIGLYRDPATLQAVEYYFKAPHDLSDRTVILMDPMLATGNSACASASRLPRTSSMQLLKGNLEQAVTTTILTMTLSLIWGAILTIVITLVARGLGV